MSKIKLFVALCGNERVYFDADGRIYEVNLLVNRYLPTSKFVYEEYVCIPLLLLCPEYLPTGIYAPEDDFTYEIIE